MQRSPTRLGRDGVGAAVSRADPLLLPGGLALATFAVLATREAGYAPAAWYAAALFLVATLAVVVFTRPRTPLPRPASIALALLGAYAAWSFLSIAWADVAATALDGANRTLLYVVVYALFVTLSWRARSAAILLGGHAVAVAALGVMWLVRAALAGSPDSFFLVGRFSEPAGYQNANCALFLSGFWPALCLASRREVPVLLRAVMLAAAGAQLELALLTQSRGSVVAFPATLAVYFLLVPGRVRSLIALVPVVAAAAIAAPTLLRVFEAFTEGGDAAGAVGAASLAVLLTSAGLFSVGVGIALVDRRVEVRPATARVLARGIGVAAAIAAAIAVVAALAVVGRPVDRVERAWEEFRADDRPRTTESYFAQGFGSNRYDIYRVAWGEFRRAPLIGSGADNFAVAYVQHRRSDEEPQYPHSLELRLLSQTGIVGTLLFGAFVTAAAVAAAGRLRRLPPFPRAVGAVGVVVFAYWAIHGSIDWFWELPALAGPAFAALGLAAAIERPRAPTRPWRPVGAAATGAALVGAVAVLVPPWLAAKEVDAAASGWRADSGAAFARLERARALNPLSDQPDVVAGAIASRLDDPPAMRRYFRRALERNDRNWYAYLELGIAEAQLGRRAEAMLALARAQALNPRERVISSVAGDVRAGRRLDPAEIDRIFFSRLSVDPRKGRSGGVG